MVVDVWWGLTVSYTGLSAAAKVKFSTVHAEQLLVQGREVQVGRGSLQFTQSVHVKHTDFPRNENSLVQGDWLRLLSLLDY